MAQQPKTLNPYKLTAGQLVEILNNAGHGAVTTPATVTNWKKKPDFVLNPDGRTYRLDTVAAWLAKERKNRSSLDGEEKISLDREMAEARLRSLQASADEKEAKAKLKEMQRKLDLGELLEATRVKQEQMDRAAWIAHVLDELPGFAPRLQGLTLAQARKELGAISRELRTRMADGEPDGQG